MPLPLVTVTLSVSRSPGEGSWTVPVKFTLASRPLFMDLRMVPCQVRLGFVVETTLTVWPATKLVPRIAKTCLRSVRVDAESDAGDRRNDALGHDRSLLLWVKVATRRAAVSTRAKTVLTTRAGQSNN